MLSEFKKIKLFVFDVDGVLTDGSVIVVNEGDPVRTMNVYDGYALQHAVKSGYDVMVISGGKSDAVKLRLNKLKVENVNMQIEDKLSVLRKYAEQKNLAPENILFMGDDLPDLACMNWVGLSCCPANAVQEIKSISKYISPKSGGEGCVRDVIEKVLKLNGDWHHDTSLVNK